MVECVNSSVARQANISLKSTRPCGKDKTVKAKQSQMPAVTIKKILKCCIAGAFVQPTLAALHFRGENGLYGRIVAPLESRSFSAHYSAREARIFEAISSCGQFERSPTGLSLPDTVIETMQVLPNIGAEIALTEGLSAKAIKCVSYEAGRSDDVSKVKSKNDVAASVIFLNAVVLAGTGLGLRVLWHLGEYLSVQTTRIQGRHRPEEMV